MNARTPIGALLVQRGLVDTAQVEHALGEQRRCGGRIGDALLRLGYVSESNLLKAVAQQYGVPYVHIASHAVDPAVVQVVPEKLMRRRKVFPVARAGGPSGVLVVATAEPGNLEALDEVAFVTGHNVQAALASDEDIEMAIAWYAGAFGDPAGAA